MVFYAKQSHTGRARIYPSATPDDPDERQFYLDLPSYWEGMPVNASYTGIPRDQVEEDSSSSEEEISDSSSLRECEGDECPSLELLQERRGLSREWYDSPWPREEDRSPRN